RILLTLPRRNLFFHRRAAALRLPALPAATARERRSTGEPAAPRARVLGDPRHFRGPLDQRIRRFGAHSGGAADRRFGSKTSGFEDADVADARRRSGALFAQRHGAGRVRGGILALPD